MTAIIGFNCVDGPVIAADTEESYPPDDKAYSNKIFPFIRDHFRLCVAGAGIGYLVDFAKDTILSAVETAVRNITDFQSQLGRTLNDLYSNEFSRYPVESPADRRIQLLVSAQFVSEGNPSAWTAPELFACQSNLVTKVPKGRSYVIGVGELLKETAAQFAGWGLTPSLAEWTSIYLIHEAKRRFGGVGGKTHIFTMKHDGTHSYSRGQTLWEKESIIEGFARASQLMMLSLDHSLTESKSKDLVNAGTAWMKHARRYLHKVEREYGKAKHTSIVIRSREMEKWIKELNAAMPSASQKSEPER